MPFLIHKELETMSSKFDSSFLENVSRSNSFKTAEENIYFSLEESVGGDYCGLSNNNSTSPQSSRHPSSSGSANQERSSSTQNARGNIDLERKQRHKRVTLQDDAGPYVERLPVSSTHRGQRARLVSDSEVYNHSVISRRPGEWSNHRTVSRNPPEPTVRVQPSGSSYGNRSAEAQPKSISYGNRRADEGLPSNYPNRVITTQPKPRGMLPQKGPENRRTKDSREEKRQEFTQKRLQEEPKRLVPPKESNDQPVVTYTDELDLNMNCNDAAKTRPTMQKQSSVENPVNHSDRREERHQDRGEKRPHHRHIENTKRDAAFLTTNDNTRQENKAPSSSARRNEEIEMTSMPCNSRIRELRWEENPGKNPLLRLAFPRPHSFDVQENKAKASRTFSSPELRVSSLEDLLGDRNDSEKYRGNEHRPQIYKNENERGNRSNNSHRSSKPLGKIRGKRSKSLPVTGRISSVGRRGPSAAEASPLRYFAYLGKRFQIRERFLSTHNVQSARPVILTSTSVISPEVTTNFCQQLEDQGSDSCDESVKQQGACQDLIDCCTCMCCVKALFYHCTKDDENECYYAEHPCSCNGPDSNCFCRWCVLGMLSLVMPCILCYLPLQGCKMGVEYLRRSGNPDCE